MIHRMSVNPHPFPAEFSYLYIISADFFDTEEVSWSDLKSYCCLAKVGLSLNELRLVKHIHRTYRGAVDAKRFASTAKG